MDLTLSGFFGNFITITGLTLEEATYPRSTVTVPEPAKESSTSLLEVNSLTLVVCLVDSSLISFLLKLLQRGLTPI